MLQSMGLQRVGHNLATELNEEALICRYSNIYLNSVLYLARNIFK